MGLAVWPTQPRQVLARAKNIRAYYNKMIGRILTVVAWVAASAMGSITNCDPNSVFKPSRLALYPDPPMRGKPVDMIVELQNPGPEIYDGKATTSLSLNYIPLSPSVKPLCEDTECPLVSGFNNRSTSSVWPDTVSGKVNSKIVWTGPAGESLLCIQMTTTVTVDESKALTVREMWRGTHKPNHTGKHLRPISISTIAPLPESIGKRHLRHSS
jgi:hypothetical protein